MWQQNWFFLISGNNLLRWAEALALALGAQQCRWIAQLAPRSVYQYKLNSRSDIKAHTVDQLRRYRIGAKRTAARSTS